jgi:hypothetical protein
MMIFFKASLPVYADLERLARPLAQKYANLAGSVPQNRSVSCAGLSPRSGADNDIRPNYSWGSTESHPFPSKTICNGACIPSSRIRKIKNAVEG